MVGAEGTLKAFDADCICCNLYMRPQISIKTAKIADELIRGVRMSTSPHTWRKRTGSQLKTLETVFRRMCNYSPDRKLQNAFSGEIF